MSRYQETLSAADQTAGSAQSSHAQQPSLCQCSSPNCIQESCWDTVEKSFHSLEKGASKKIDTIVEEGGPDELYEVIHERESFEEDEAEEEEDGEGEDDFAKDDVFAKEGPLTPAADPDYECIVVNEVAPPAEKQAVENLNDWRASCLCNFKQAQDSLLDRYIKHYSETWQFSRHLQKLGNTSCTCSMHDTSNKATVVRDFCPNYHPTRDLRRCAPKKRTCAMERRIDPTPIDFLDKSIEQFCRMAKGKITKKDNDCVIINCSLDAQSDESQETLCSCEPPPPPPKKEKPNRKPKANKNIQPCPVFQAMQKSNEYLKHTPRSRVTATSTSEMGRAKKSKKKLRRGSLVKFGSLDETNKKRLNKFNQRSRERLYNRRKTPAVLPQPVGIVTRATQMSRERECRCAPEDDNVWEDVEDDDSGGGGDDDDDDDDNDGYVDDNDYDDDDDDDRCVDICENVNFLPPDDKNCPCTCTCGQDVDDVEEAQPPIMTTKSSQTNKQKSKKKTIYIKICNGFQNAPPPPPPKAECQCACAPPKNSYKIQETQSERAKPTCVKSLNDKSKILSQKCCKERPFSRRSLPKVCLKKLSTSSNKCRELLAKEQSRPKSGTRTNLAQSPRCHQKDCGRDRTRLVCCQSSRQSQHNAPTTCAAKPCLRACVPPPTRTKSVESAAPFGHRRCYAMHAQRERHRTKATQSVDECTCVSQKDNKQVACKPQQCDNYTETCQCVGGHGPYECGLCSSTDLKTACSLADLESPLSFGSNICPCAPPLRANNSDTCACPKNYASPCSNQFEMPTRSNASWYCKWAQMNPRVIRMQCPGPRYCIAYNHQIQCQSFYPNTAVQVDSMELIRNEPPTKLNVESQRSTDVAIQASDSFNLASLQIVSDVKSLRGDKYEQPERDHTGRRGTRERNRRNVSDNASNTFDAAPSPPILITGDMNVNRDRVNERNRRPTPTQSVEEKIAEDSAASVTPPKTLPPSRPRESKRVSMKYDFPAYTPSGAARSGTDSIEERIRILRKNLEAKHGSESNSAHSQATIQSFGKDTEVQPSVDEHEMTSQLLSRRLTAGKVITK